MPTANTEGQRGKRLTQVLELLAKQCERYKLRDVAKKLWNLAESDAAKLRLELIERNLRCANFMGSSMNGVDVGNGHAGIGTGSKIGLQAVKAAVLANNKNAPKS